MSNGAAQDADTIDLVGIWRSAWAHRLPVLVTALLCAVAGFALGMLLLQSHAGSFLQLSYTVAANVTSPANRQGAVGDTAQADTTANDSGMDPRLRLGLAEYKVVRPRTITGASFVEYATKRQLLESSLLARLGREVARDDVLADWVRPVFAIERADLRLIPDAPQGREPNYVVGLQIDVERRSGAEALSLANALFEYVRDTVVLLRAREITSSMSFIATSRQLDLDRTMVKARFDLSQAEQRHKELSAIRGRYPEVGRGDVRQVISVDGTSSRFLPPVVQLVGAETRMAELRETLRRAEWDSERSRALLAFLEPAQRIIEKARGTADLFGPLDQLTAATFDAERLKADPWRDARDAVNAELLVLKTLYSGPMGLTKAPKMREPSLKRRVFPALVGFMLGAILSAAVLGVRDGLLRPSRRAVSAGV